MDARGYLCPFLCSEHSTTGGLCDNHQMWSKQRSPGSEIGKIKYSDSDSDSINDAVLQKRWIIEDRSLGGYTMYTCSYSGVRRWTSRQLD